MKRVACLALPLALWLLAPRAAMATDVVLRQKTSSGRADSPTPARSGESTQYWTQKMMVVDEAGMRMIVDFASEKLTSLDKGKKTYLILSFDDMKAQMDASRQDMDQRTADLAPDVKAALESWGEAVGDRHAPVEVKATGKKDKIAGYEAEEYSFSGSAVNGSLWISKALPLPLGEAERRAFRKSMQGMKPAGMQFAMAMDQANGIPLRTVMNVGPPPSGTTTINEVVEVREASPPADLIAVPEGFSPQRPPAATSAP